MVLADGARHKSGAERAADCLGGEHRLRQFLAQLADAWTQGGKVIVESDAIPGSGVLLRAPLVLHGTRAW